MAPGFTFVHSMLSSNSSFTKPDSATGITGYFGPNLLLAVPELNGSTAGLPFAFVALGLLALGGRRSS